MDFIKIVFLAMILNFIIKIYDEVKVEQEYLDDIEYYKHEDIN